MLPQGQTSVVVADVVPLVRAGIASVLAPHGFSVVGEASRASELPRLVARAAPAVVVVGTVGDLPLQDVVRLLRGPQPTDPVRLVLLLARAPRELLAELLQLDVDALLSRGTGAVELASALARVCSGERVVDPTLLSDDAPDDDEEAAALTTREREVLELLTSGRSNREIASALFVSLPTVKTHLAHIYAKLGAKNRNEALGRAMALGLLP